MSRMCEWLRSLLHGPQMQVTGIKDSHSVKSVVAIGQANNVIFNLPSSTDPDPGFSHATLVYSKDDEDDVMDLRSTLQDLQLYNGNRVSVALEEEIVPDGVTEVEAFGKQSSPNSPVQTREAHLRVYHAVIIYDEADKDKVLTLQTDLNSIVLGNGVHANVALLDDVQSDGETEVASFDQCFQKCVLMFLFISEPFMKNVYERWRYEVGLTESLKYGSRIDGRPFVIPVFTDNKDTASYLRDKPILRAVCGIKHHGCTGKKSVDIRFRRDLEEAEQRRQIKLNGTTVD
ncbi:uncharacterized protein LOC124287712 [Haliotis rubra]|uniref:uncharacterized protein LOC124287712 n=1 Tax=Haliotis rubra TaxID=36100 RepID=UPI001EE5B0E7|nr:uncharacterized protein LOC124287712 [Haliotis rubra]